MKLIVIIREKFAGCLFYRLYQPYNHLAKQHNVKVLFTDGLHMTDDELRQHDAVIWHKAYYDFKDIRRAKELGLFTIVDFDDHWILPKDHVMFRDYIRDGVTTKLHKLIRMADLVTCTTERLASEIYKHNTNVHILANAMDMNYPGCKVDRSHESDYIFGYLGGHTHYKDLRHIRGVQSELTRNISGYKFRLFGYIHGDKEYESYADIMSDNGKSKNFSLYKGADIWNYPQFYNYLDCSLVPLEDSFFNSMKSPLKLIEAGFFSKAVIVSPVAPYDEIITKDNCLTARNKTEWIAACERLIKNKNLSLELGAALHESVQKYSIINVNKKRYNVLENQYINSGRELSGMVNV